MPVTAARIPWYYTPAVLIVAGCLVAIVNFGVRSSFGFFTAPISEAHQWPREIFSFALAMQNLLWGVATPIAGMLADRYGSARVLMTGAVVYSIGTVMMAFTDTPVMFTIGGGILVGIGIALSSFSIVMAALGRIVPPEKRSWAFGIATASGSLGQFIFAPLGAALISAYGWQHALTVLSLCILLIIPFALPLMVQNRTETKPNAGEADLTMRQALGMAFGHGSYWLLISGFFVCGFQLAFITVHLPPYLGEHGISKEVAGIAMGSIGLFNVIGSYASGVIGGRMEKRVPLAIIYLLRSVLVTAFILLPITPVTTLIFTASLGLLWLSTVPFTMALVTVMFGTRYMATLYGFVFLSHQVGSFLGVWLGGKLYDQFGTYDPVWWMGVGLGLFAFIVHLPIREQRAPQMAAA
ncbi:MFS transporter [Aestuariivirga sp.]|uniref:MFS transporter n=1 Tax=Aestuariivirga sp. TaxID=2650926 RepID=UPI0035935717